MNRGIITKHMRHERTCAHVLMSKPDDTTCELHCSSVCGGQSLTVEVSANPAVTTPPRPELSTGQEFKLRHAQQHVCSVRINLNPGIKKLGNKFIRS